jgi:hydrogenase nickel incorporation protein HypB
MHKRIEINRSLRSANQEAASENRCLFLEHGLKVINIMSSPGSGKTTLLEKTAARLGGEQIAVLVGDISTQRDAERVKLAAAGVQAVQIVTEEYGSACHLDAKMIQAALGQLKLDGLRFLFIENVGNLVCPAGLALGEDKRVVLLSVPEGDDKVKKYPVIFGEAELLIVSKLDLIGACEFDPARVEREARELNGQLECIKLSSKSGQGMDDWFAWLDQLLTSAN